MTTLRPTTHDIPHTRFAPPPWTDDPRRHDAVARLDLTPLYAAYHGTGALPYRLDLLLKAVLYLSQRGRHSPTDWYRDAHECLPVRWLRRGCTPPRSCWYAFRDRLAPVVESGTYQLTVF
jgi:hypothetical protein